MRAAAPHFRWPVRRVAREPVEPALTGDQISARQKRTAWLPERWWLRAQPGGYWPTAHYMVELLEPEPLLARPLRHNQTGL